MQQDCIHPWKVFSGIAQDDMELAPDFFPYFEALAPVLDQDDRLLCISSWNDHGQVPPGCAACKNSADLDDACHVPLVGLRDDMHHI